MPLDIKPAKTVSEPSRVMGFSLELKKSAKWQQNSNKAKQTALPTQANQSLEHQAKLNANGGISVLPKSSGNRQQQSVKSKATKDDELVKYMSNLPAYLQRMECVENIQDKALNMGVLDWARLEKWKRKQKCIPTSDGNNASSTGSNWSTKMNVGSSTFLNAVHNQTLTNQRVQHPSQDAKLSIRNVKCFHDFETLSKSGLDGEKKVPWTHKSFGKNNMNIILDKRESKYFDENNSKEGKLLSNSKYNALPIRTKEDASVGVRETKKRVEEIQESDIRRKVLDGKINLSMGASSSKLRSQDVSCSAKEKKKVGDGETKKRTEQLQESAIDLSRQHLPDGNKNIILLFPRNFSQNSCPEEPRTSFDENLTEGDQSSLSNEDIHFSELCSEIPHSCPLPSAAETNTKPCKMAHATINARDAELSSDEPHKSASLHGVPLKLSASEYVEKNSIKASNGTDQETAELATRKGRHPSPNRRFSFSLGQMTRSFSFKESLAVPQLSSTYVSVKSGPVISKASPNANNSNREKASCHSRARSSPLRRILDPLLKSKSLGSHHSAETDQPLKGSLNSLSFKPIDASESLKNERHDASSIRALLHLTVRNGLPFFRFVVHNNSSLLAAPMKNLTSSGKNDSGYNYTFYTIDEIKKKSGSWINQGSKGKNCGYVYNVVGQMKVNNTSSFDLTGRNPTSQYCKGCIIKESVLFGVELRQADQASQSFMPTRELAAVVVKTPGEKSSLDSQQSDKVGDLMENNFSWCPLENGCSCNLGLKEHSTGAVVILPGGIHGLPNRGAPSPLIHRWRSGGSCDCGGWDVGCKLLVLSTEDRCCKILRTSKSRLASHCFELFVQGGAQQDTPILNLTPLEKGMHSIEFSPSISLLQAFFICVTVISGQKSSDLVQASNLSEEKVLWEPRNASDEGKKMHNTIPKEAPIKYTPSPPVSPVGRV